MGVLTDADLLRLQAKSPLYLLRAIERVAGTGELSRYATDLAAMVESLSWGGLEATRLGPIVVAPQRRARRAAPAPRRGGARPSALRVRVDRARVGGTARADARHRPGQRARVRGGHGGGPRLLPPARRARRPGPRGRELPAVRGRLHRHRLDAPALRLGADLPALRRDAGARGAHAGAQLPRLPRGRRPPRPRGPRRRRARRRARPALPRPPRAGLDRPRAAARRLPHAAPRGGRHRPQEGRHRRPSSPSLACTRSRPARSPAPRSSGSPPRRKREPSAAKARSRSARRSASSPACACASSCARCGRAARSTTACRWRRCRRSSGGT